MGIFWQAVGESGVSKDQRHHFKNFDRTNTSQLEGLSRKEKFRLYRERLERKLDEIILALFHFSWSDDLYSEEALVRLFDSLQIPPEISPAVGLVLEAFTKYRETSLRTKELFESFGGNIPVFLFKFFQRDEFQYMYFEGDVNARFNNGVLEIACEQLIDFARISSQNPYPSESDILAARFTAGTSFVSEKFAFILINTMGRTQTEINKTLRHESLHVFCFPFRDFFYNYKVPEMPKSKDSVGRIISELTPSLREEVLWRILEGQDYEDISAYVSTGYDPFSEKGPAGNHTSNEVRRTRLANLFGITVEKTEIYSNFSYSQMDLMAFEYNKLISSAVEACKELAELGLSAEKVVLRLIRFPLHLWPAVVSRARLAHTARSQKPKKVGENG